MAQADDIHESGRRETIDSTSGGSRTAGGGHLGSYISLAIAGMLLMAMMFLQNASSAIY